MLFRSRTLWRDSRVPASVPNISGAWQTRGYLRRIQPADGGATPWLPWTQSAFEKRSAAEKAGAPMFDPTAACMPSGVPRIIAAPYPIEIVQTPDKTVILEEVQHLFRIIHMDRRTHPKGRRPSFIGWKPDMSLGPPPQVGRRYLPGSTRADSILATTSRK